MPDTALIGTATSCDVPEKRAERRTQSLSIVRRRVAELLMLRTISPFFTNAAGTRVCAFTLTARYGVRPLSAHHSQMARTRYGLADCSDMVDDDIPPRITAVKRRTAGRPGQPICGAFYRADGVTSAFPARPKSAPRRTPAGRTAARRISSAGRPASAS